MPEKRILEIKGLNTLTCRVKSVEHGQVKVDCTIHSHDEHDNEEIKTVYAVGGDIVIIPSIEFNECKVHIKTSPHIGLDAKLIIEERTEATGSFPQGKFIHIVEKPIPERP